MIDKAKTEFQKMAASGGGAPSSPGRREEGTKLGRSATLELKGSVPTIAPTVGGGTSAETEAKLRRFDNRIKDIEDW